MKTLCLALVGALAAAVPVHTSPCQQAEPPAARSGPFVLEAGEIEVAALIDRVAEYMGYNVLYSEAEVQAAGPTGGRIRLTRRTETDRDGCWELFGSLLYHKGFAVLALDEARGLYEVVMIAGQRGREIASGAKFVPHGEVERYAALRAIPIMTTVPLQNVNAPIATNALRPFFASTGSASTGITIGNVGNTSDILLAGFGPQVAAACRLLKLVDTADDDAPTMTVVYLQHAAAEELVQRLEDTLGARAMQTAGQAGYPLGAPLRSVAHPALNAIILSGNPTQLRDATALIDKLDLATKAQPQAATGLGERLEQLEQRLQRLERALRAGGVGPGKDG